MRYFARIVVLIVLFACSVLVFAYYQQPRMDEAVLLSIGSEKYRLEDLEECFQKNLFGSTDRTCFIESLIDRQLLLQEAQRQRLDQEPAFVKFMQDYLEQSLLRLVVDRFYARLEPEVTPEEVDYYLANQDFRLSIRIFSYADGVPDAAADQFLSQRVVTQKFTIFPLAYRQSVAGLTPGQVSQPFRQDGHIVRVQLLARIASTGAVGADDRQQATSRLLKEKKKQMMEEWPYQLREQTSIVTTPELERWKTSHDQ